MFHIHKWPKWGDVTYEVTERYRGRVIKGIQQGQERVCLKCGITRNRML